MDELMVIRAIHGASKLSNVAFDEAIESIKDETDPKIDLLCQLANDCEEAYEQALIHLIEGNSVECREMLEAIDKGETAAAKYGMANYVRPILGMFP